jgi:hypothetical protein
VPWTFALRNPEILVVRPGLVGAETGAWGLTAWDGHEADQDGAALGLGKYDPGDREANRAGVALGIAVSNGMIRLESFNLSAIP